MNQVLFDSLLVIYLTQAAIGFALFFIFRHFSLLYNRRYLLTWSWSWLSFSGAVALFGYVAVATVRYHIGFWPVQLLNFLSLVLGYSHLIFFLVGVTELVSEQDSKRSTLLKWLGASVLLSALLVISYSSGEEIHPLRDFLRIGIRMLITALSFIVAGLVIHFTKRLSGGLGHRIMSWSMILFGIEQGYYCVIVVMSSLFSINVSFPHFIGVIDIAMIFGIGLGMIIWLLEDERRKLKKANQELDSFVYSTSHDLRAPIASMLGLVNLARMEVRDEKSLELIGMIEQRVKKLDSVIGDFLTLSRSKKSQVEMVPVSLNQLIDEVVNDVKFAQDAPSIRLIYDRSHNFTFKSDFTLMKTALGNLFSNSVKYHNVDQPDPFIRVAFRRVNGKVQIDVEDNGQGIRSENLGRIFDMFYRASTSSNGTGLGLYIVKEALAKVDGIIFVKSFYGVGSTFTILLPQPKQ